MAFLSGFLEKQQNEGNQQSQATWIKSTLKGVVNVGEAIVSAVSNTGIAGFKFHCPQSEQILLKNNITTHFVENNEPVQDHIACEPIEVTLRGFQGEYVYDLHPKETAIRNVVTAIPLVQAMLPQVSTVYQQLKTDFSQITKSGSFSGGIAATIGVGVDIWALYQTLFTIKSAQTRAYYFFQALRDSKMLVTVETSWRKFNNMAVESVTPLRDNNADITDITVKFKQMSFAETLIVKPEAKGRTNIQKADTQNKGIDKGQQVDFK